METGWQCGATISSINIVSRSVIDYNGVQPKMLRNANSKQK